MISAIFRSDYPYSRFRLFKSYCKLVAESIYHHYKAKRSSTKLRSLFFTSKSIFDFTVCFSNYGQLIDMFEEIFILQSYRYHSSDREKLIMDAGANIGLAVLYFKLLDPSSQIVSFEPHNETFGLLQINVTQNNLQNVIIHNKALGNREGTGQLYGSKSYSLNMSLNEHQGDYRKEFQQPVTINLLSSFIKSKVTLLKIDVEGSEQEIVEDIIASGKTDQLEQIIVEFHPRPKVTITDLTNQLSACGFKVTTGRGRSGTKETLVNFSKK